MAKNGVTQTFEVGARIHKEMETAAVGTPDDVAAAAAKIKEA